MFKTKEEYQKDAARVEVVFHIHTYEGIIPLEQKGTPEELQAQLVAINRDGLTLPNQDGFEWYPTASIKKVKVEAR